MKAEVIKLDSEHPERSFLERAAHLLTIGSLVAFPTDTVYGLGTTVFDGRAVEKIFEVKKRPKDKPIAILLSSLAQLELVAERIPKMAYRLMDEFWPGPLSLIVPANPHVPSVVTGGKSTVALRVPDNEIALRLIGLSGPIATTSANLAGNPSPKDAAGVKKELADKVGLIIDGGPAKFGEVSTVLDLTTPIPQVVREGVITEAEINQVLG